MQATLPGLPNQLRTTCFSLKKQHRFLRSEPQLLGLSLTWRWMCPELIKSHLKGTKHALLMSQVPELELVVSATWRVSTLYPGSKGSLLTRPLYTITPEKKSLFIKLMSNYDHNYFQHPNQNHSFLNSTQYLHFNKTNQLLDNVSFSDGLLTS